MAKRLFDLLLSSVGLLLLAPLLLLIAALVKLDSPGPVMFRQERVGRFGRPFRIHKFRTMRHEPAGQGLQITDVPAFQLLADEPDKGVGAPGRMADRQIALLDVGALGVVVVPDDHETIPRDSPCVELSGHAGIQIALALVGHALEMRLGLPAREEPRQQAVEQCLHRGLFEQKDEAPRHQLRPSKRPCFHR